MTPLWVFGYGSLLWKTGFPYAERRLARLVGYHRSFCMASVHYRGTPEVPGLVLALDAREDATCQGVGFRVEDDHAEATLAYLRERELVSSAYYEAKRMIELDDGTMAEAVCYIVDREHHQYRGGLSLAEQAQIIAAAQGSTGQNTEYLFQTAKHLEELNIPDRELSELVEEVNRILAGQNPV